jgi:acetolactate synthase small subunit
MSTLAFLRASGEELLKELFRLEIVQHGEIVDSETNARKFHLKVESKNSTFFLNSMEKNFETVGNTSSGERVYKWQKEFMWTEILGAKEAKIYLCRTKPRNIL